MLPVDTIQLLINKRASHGCVLKYSSDYQCAVSQNKGKSRGNKRMPEIMDTY